MEASEVLTKAWSAVQASGVPESLYEVAFREAIVLLDDTRPAGRAALPVNRGSALVDPPVESAGETTEIDTEATIQAFAEESDIVVAELVEVFYFDSDGSAHLNVAGRKLGESTAAKAKAVATAIAAAYYYAEDEPTVSVEIVRSECQRLKCFDKKNFFTHMGAAPGTVLSGSGNNRVLRIKPNEIQAALQTVVSVARGTKE